MGGNTSKIVIYDNARVNGGTNYDAKGEDMMTLGHTYAALLSLLEFVFDIKYVWNIDEITYKIFSTSFLNSKSTVRHNLVIVLPWISRMWGSTWIRLCCKEGSFFENYSYYWNINEIQGEFLQCMQVIYC